MTGAFKCDQVQKEGVEGLAAYLEKGDRESMLEMFTQSGANRWTTVYGKTRTSTNLPLSTRRSVWASLENSDEEP
jgi:hypothetical protein